jgi:hypothetical protein
MSKKTLIAIITFLSILIPNVTFATTVTWVATSTDAGSIQPNRINGNDPFVKADHFVATSTTATSTFANGINLTKGCVSYLGTCISGGAGSNYWSISGSGIYPNTGNQVFVNRTTDDGSLSNFEVNGQSHFDGGQSYFGDGTFINLSSPAYMLATGGLGESAGYTTNRDDTNTYDSFDLLDNHASASGWSMQMQPSDENLYFVDRSNSINEMTMVSGGNIGIDNSSPAYALDINGDANLTGCYRVNGVCLSISGTNYFTNSGANTYLTTGTKLGIGTTSPFAPLSVAGSAYVGGNLTATGTITFTGINGSVQCLHADTNGVITGTGSDCGSGGGLTTVPNGGTGLTAVKSGFFLEGNGTNPLATTTALYIDGSNLLHVGDTSVSEVELGNTNLNNSYLINVGNVAFSSASTPGLLFNPGNTQNVQSTLAPSVNSLSLASSTPWGILSIGVPVYSAGKPMFVIGSSTSSGTTTPFIITANATVGIGTTTPWGLLSLQSNTPQKNASPLFVIATSTSGINGTTTPFEVDQNGDIAIGTSTPSVKIAAGTNQLSVMNVNNNTNIANFYNNVGTTQVSITNGGGLTAASLLSSGGVMYDNSNGGNAYLINNGGSSGTTLIVGANAVNGQVIVEPAYSENGTTDSFQVKMGNSAAITPFVVQDSSVSPRIGIGTTTPWGLLSIATTTSSTSAIPFIVIASSSPGISGTTTEFSIDSAGNPSFGTNNSNINPSVSCSGTCSVDVNASDSSGIIYISGVQTSITLTFDTVKPFAPHCVVSDNVTTGNYDASSTPTNVVFTTSVSLGTASISYWCPL